MGQVQNALLGAAGAVGAAAVGIKRSVGKKAPKEEKFAKATSSPSAVAAQKAQASLAEHREAKKYFVAPKLSDVSGLKVK